jgi:hypothetical protein
MGASRPDVRWMVRISWPRSLPPEEIAISVDGAASPRCRFIRVPEWPGEGGSFRFSIDPGGPDFTSTAVHGDSLVSFASEAIFRAR